MTDFARCLATLNLFFSAFDIFAGGSDEEGRFVLPLCFPRPRLVLGPEETKSSSEELSIVVDQWLDS